MQHFSSEKHHKRSNQSFDYKKATSSSNLSVIDAPIPILF